LPIPIEPLSDPLPRCRACGTCQQRQNTLWGLSADTGAIPTLGAAADASVRRLRRQRKEWPWRGETPAEAVKSGQESTLAEGHDSSEEGPGAGWPGRRPTPHQADRAGGACQRRGNALGGKSAGGRAIPALGAAGYAYR